MSDTSIPNWAIVEARKRLNKSWSKAYPHRLPITFAPHVVTPLAEMIAKHEEEPADKYTVALNNAINTYFGRAVPLQFRKGSSLFEKALLTLKETLNEQA